MGSLETAGTLNAASWGVAMVEIRVSSLTDYMRAQWRGKCTF